MSTVPRVAAHSLREAFSLQPDLFEAFWDLYGTLWMDGRVDHATKEVVRLRNARVTDCGYCKRVRFSLAREGGLAEEQAALVDDGYETSDLSERHKAAIRLADRFLAVPGRPPGDGGPAATSPEGILAEDESVELGVALAMFLGFAKMLVTLGLEPVDMPVTVVPTPGSDRLSPADHSPAEYSPADHRSADYSPVAPEVLADPFPAYADLRAHCPVHFEPQMGLYSVARHEDVVGVLRRPDLWSNRHGPGVGFSDQSLGDMQHDDPPEHQRRRNLARSWFLPSAVKRLEPDLRALAGSLIDHLEPLGAMDLYEQYALPMPVTSFCSLLGVDLDDREQFVRWADDLTTGMAFPERSVGARRAMSAFTLAEVRRRREQASAGASLPPGLLSHLATAPWDDDGGPMPDVEVVGMVNQLLVAGHETTTSLITNCVWRLLESPAERWGKLRADPGLIPAAIEESLRHDPPVLGLCRTNNRAVTIDGTEIDEMSKVMVLFASANRDEAVFGRPDEFRLDRRPDETARHLSFGWGIHHCLGSRLARLTARVAIETLVGRLPDLRLDGPTERVPSPFLWGRKKLPVRWTPAG